MARAPLDPASATVATTLKLPRATIDRIDAVRGSAARAGWIRAAIDSALGSSARAASLPNRPVVPAVPIGGQDAAAGAGVEARQRPACEPGRHPITMKLGTACGSCGEEKAWTK